MSIKINCEFNDERASMENHCPHKIKRERPSIVLPSLSLPPPIRIIIEGMEDGEIGKFAVLNIIRKRR